MATPEPEYLTAPQFAKFREALDRLENTEGVMPESTVEAYVREARFAYAEGNNNHYLMDNSAPDLHVKRAAIEARMRNLYEHLRQFEKKIELDETNSSVMEAPSPTDVVEGLLNYRDRIQQMGLSEAQKSVFYLHANYYAEKALRSGQVPEKTISELLGTYQRPTQKALPAPRPDLGKK